MHKPQDVCLFLRLSHSKSCISKVVPNVVILGINLEGAMRGYGCSFYVPIRQCLVGAARLRGTMKEERGKNDGTSFFLWLIFVEMKSK